MNSPYFIFLYMYMFVCVRVCDMHVAPPLPVRAKRGRIRRGRVDAGPVIVRTLSTAFLVVPRRWCGGQGEPDYYSNATGPRRGRARPARAARPRCSGDGTRIVARTAHLGRPEDQFRGPGRPGRGQHRHTSFKPLDAMDADVATTVDPQGHAQGRERRAAARVWWVTSWPACRVEPYHDDDDNNNTGKNKKVHVGRAPNQTFACRGGKAARQGHRGHRDQACPESTKAKQSKKKIIFFIKEQLT